MKLIRRIVYSVILIAVALAVVGFLLPSAFSVKRSVVIKADKEQVHELVGDLKQWPVWAPWTEIDPTIKTTYGEKTTGVGAHQSWKGDSGTGELTFTSADPDTGVLFDLSFEEGKYKSTGGLTYATAKEGGVEVSWTMQGDAGMNLINRYMGLLMDRMVGKDFERGLEKLKTKAEGKK